MAKRKPQLPIEPKPTSYGGVMFRSRLEARWAVFFDFSPNVLNWGYEPTTFYDSGNREYTPDFSVEVFGWGREKPRQDTTYIEIKPDLITPEYTDFLARMSRENSFVLFVIMGDFFTMEFSSFALHNGRQRAVPIDSVFRGHNKAATVASNYRFDLKG